MGLSELLWLLDEKQNLQKGLGLHSLDKTALPLIVLFHNGYSEAKFFTNRIYF